MLDTLHLRSPLRQATPGGLPICDTALPYISHLHPLQQSCSKPSSPSLIGLVILSPHIWLSCQRQLPRAYWRGLLQPSEFPLGASYQVRGSTRLFNLNCAPSFCRAEPPRRHAGHERDENRPSRWQCRFCYVVYGHDCGTGFLPQYVKTAVRTRGDSTDMRNSSTISINLFLESNAAHKHVYVYALLPAYQYLIEKFLTSKK
jgi:hypothetical protein